jgi:ferric-dicitrate binding protein FerR (iron transport regulator)
MEQRISYLLQQRLKNRLTPAEEDELLELLRDPQYDAVVTDLLQGMALSGERGPAFDPVVLQQWVDQIVAVDKVHDIAGVGGRGESGAGRERVGRRPRTIIPLWTRYAAAVLLFAAIGGGLWYGHRQQVEATDRQVASRQPDIAPGGNKAVLTLSDGSAIILDSAANGKLTQQGNTEVIKSASGQLAYHTGTGGADAVSGTAASDASALYNTITTPRGGQYQVSLPDGSKVWLNAGSSLHFPTVFNGRSRDVEITGEAYFEIAKDVRKPFYVKVNGLSVEVLGTHFDINAYTDEPVIRTTLLEGGVRVRQGDAAAMLKPGQQAQAGVQAGGGVEKGAGGPGGKKAGGAGGGGMITVVSDADVQEAVAWKDGLFYMSSADIGTVMRQLSRWYDVEVNFEGGVPSGHISGEIPRNRSLSKVLHMLETSGVHCRLEGRKLIVMP